MGVRVLSLQFVRQAFKRGWHVVLPVTGCVASLVGCYFALRPVEEISYRLRVQNERVFDGGHNPSLMLLHKTTEHGKHGLTKPIHLEGEVWRPCTGPVGALELEIINSGRRGLWYEHHETNVLRNVVGPVRIRLTPETEILAAWPVRVDPGCRGFAVEQGTGWAKGYAECKWHSFHCGKSVTVRVLYVQPDATVGVHMEGELTNNPEPKRLGPPRSISVYEAVRRPLYVVVFALVGAYAILYRVLRAVKLGRLDRQQMDSKTLPDGVGLTTMGYLRKEAWAIFALCVLVFLLFVLCR